MSKLKVTHIKAHLDRNFKGKIDLTDIKDRPKAEIEKNFYSRALAAYSLTIIAVASIDDAANSVVDGFDDNGIDAIYFDALSKNLWLVQSKFIESGVGGIDNGDVEKYTKGVKNLIDTKFSRFNAKVKKRQHEILDALQDATVKIQVLFAYTGKKLSTHNEASINDLIDELNDNSDLVRFNDFNIDKAHKGLVVGLNSEPINEDVIISNWGYIDEPYKSYYGQINGAELGELWLKYGRRLFTENIRSFLGTSDVNDEIITTIKTEPANFIYFNNGITILCESIKKKPISGSDRNLGAFECQGMSIVNGAQTLGSIGSLSEIATIDLSNIKVFVKFISLEGSPEGFGHRITIATNTQNKVDKKDFVSLNAEQERLKIDLKLEGIDYHFKRSDEKILPDETNYLLEEVAFSLASLWDDVTLTTTVKKASGKLWEDVQNRPYIDLFNNSISAVKIIKAVKVYRFVTNKMKQLSYNSEGRQRSIYLYGNTFVSHILFQRIPKQHLADSSTEFENYFNNELEKKTDDCLNELENLIETNYPEAMIGFIFRNYTKCRDLKALMI